MKKQIKKSKRLEFTQSEIDRFDKIAKKEGRNFKSHAEKVIRDIANSK
jgi:hypothetical protein